MLKLISRAIVLVGCFVLLIIFGIRSCGSHVYPRPSSAYYVSDFAEVLDPATENFIISTADTLYEDTKNIDEIGGTQIVFATFLVENNAEIANYDKNTLFREWEIGKNDMGVLVIFFFTKTVIDDLDYYDLKQMQVETGYHMTPYLTDIELNTIYSDTLNYYLPAGTLTYPYDEALDMGVGSMMNELLNVAYGEIYLQPDNVVPQSEFDPWYQDYILDYSGSTSTGANSPMDVFTFFFAGFGSLSDKILFGVFGMLFMLAGGFSFAKGGGGSSGGGGLFKRR